MAFPETAPGEGEGGDGAVGRPRRGGVSGRGGGARTGRGSRSLPHGRARQPFATGSWSSVTHALRSGGHSRLISRAYPVER